MMILFQLLCLASIVLSHPTVLENPVDVPYGSFVSPVPSSTSLSPTATPTPSSTDARIGRAIIDNHCKIPIYIWSVGTVTRDPATVLPGNRYGETFREDHETGGIAIKISTDENGLYNSAPLTVFAYNINGQNVWYDLSDVFGDPFKGYPVALSPAEPPIQWAGGIPPAGSQVRVQDLSEDLVLTLC
ncbi:Antigenic thaumatin-like protein [Penicillium cataractarum]|uniref:Antigenic thaumatin-like protein n=1 Tax=Penicillium cataractarum TaxID=2100454 RepID=A0A9W9VG56_9EURO|nr:Antigenic thaumatin-like protein [Penicillium cataractarum]KAJ5380963.1 Antigenic thaumatin-like protein [Penicillium cataractarum]